MGKRRSSFVASDDSGEERPVKVAKKAEKGSKSSGGADVDSEGNTFWELSNKRRVVVQKFKGNMFVNLREYYEDSSGAMKPGKKGIMMSIDQYRSLANLVPSINAELRKNGVAIDNDAVDDGQPSGGKAMEAGKISKKVKSEAKRANIEATSDEDDED
ncbi:PC4-domain-containing protein [Cryphonectria parasitica EP155]|uniref:PC4-domain-containing protein n=1 Tax=Cryphonectria parasitica (strain ATCC 38755 / EP155) TaxID=660469 RepID=A0A9P4XUL6_CRYP1|nr:PC4-domain-containing protein [Cryphonectria parasitica EP155]KAF3761183.1 PC4-domain-containing protein [Cryphonectria parasitica EP155]